MDASALEYQLRLTAQRILDCLTDLSPDEMVARPQGLAPILWQLGHLSLSDTGLARRAGMDLAIPDGYEALFARGTTGDGPYPPHTEVVRFFEAAQNALLELARGDLNRPAASPIGAYQTVGGGLSYNLYHRGYHHGKMMTLRALLGKPRLLG